MTLPRFAAAQWLSIVAVLSGILYLLGPRLTPFAFVAILVYICNPVVNRMAGCRLPRTLAIVMGEPLVGLRHADAWYLDSTMYRAP